MCETGTAQQVAQLYDS